MASMLQMLTTPVSGGELARLAQETRAASMQPYQPGMRERLGNALYDLFGRNATANRIRNEGMMLADFIPGVGDAIGAQEAASDYQAGNYLGAGLGGVATAMGVIPGAGDAMGRAVKSAEEPIRQGIRAFHGSPHDFDRFSMDNIGTGEGAQAYGHGLYFAESEDVARGYRDRLSTFDAYGSRKPSIATVDGIPAREIGQDVWEVADQLASRNMSVDEYISDLQRRIDSTENPARADVFLQLKADAERVAEKLRGKNVKFDQGRMYEVSINANPEDFLDWDAPLSAQPEIVQQIAREMPLDGLSSRQRGMLQKWRDGTANELEVPTGSELHSMLTDFGTDGQANAALTSRLSAQGIPGIRYLDGNSRGAGEGSRNYVVFDDSLISIVRKYGIAAAIAGGIITREQAEQMQAQGVI